MSGQRTVLGLRVRAPTRARERGASAVEFALIAPIFFMIVFGGISAAVAYDRSNTVTHAAREGARAGATLPTDGVGSVPDAWFDQVAMWARESANGHLDPAIDGRYICVAYVGYGSTQNNVDDWTKKRVEGGDGAPVYSNGSLNDPGTWCFNDGRGSDGTERRVQVVVGRDTEFNVVFWGRTISLRSNGVARFEAVTPS